MNTPDVSIQLVTTANSWLMNRVDDDVFDDPIQPALLQAYLTNPANVLVVAVVRDQVIGMASGFAYVHPDKPLQLFINELGVAERFQRQGIGKKLLQTLLQRGRELGCQEAWVATGAGNSPARALYRSGGGAEDDERAVVYSYSLVEEQECVTRRKSKKIKDEE